MKNELKLVKFENQKTINKLCRQNENLAKENKSQKLQLKNDGPSTIDEIRKINELLKHKNKMLV